MEQRPSGIRILPGTTDILVVAPHGPFIDGEYQNDLRTGIIAEEIHRQLGCATIINDLFFKPKGEITKSFEKYFLDLFRIDHAGKVPGYIDRIEAVANRDGKTLVIWVHGISDDFAANQGQAHLDLGVFDRRPVKLCALIGYGQGGDPKTGDAKDRLTASQETVEAVRDRLTSGGMTTVLTHKKGSNYRGRDSKRFNQWFVQRGYGFDRVESLQLEIKESGFRDSRANAVKTAGIIADALVPQ